MSEMERCCYFCNEKADPLEYDMCSCDEFACKKCANGTDFYSTEKRQLHLRCELRMEYETILKERDVDHKNQIEECHQKIKYLESRYDTLQEHYLKYNKSLPELLNVITKG